MRVLAGGLGFEPRLAESESAVLPLDDPPRIEFRKTLRPALSLSIRERVMPRQGVRSTLRVLRTATCLAATDFLALDFARIACNEARLPQRFA